MADLKISEMGNASALGGTEQIPVVQGGANKKATPAQMKTYVLSGRLNQKVVEIGDWNMDTTDFVNVAHGLADITKIRAIEVIIRNDAGTGVYSVGKEPSLTGSGVQQAWFLTGATNVIISRIASGLYDSNSFDSTGYNRGWVTIWYAS